MVANHYELYLVYKALLLCAMLIFVHNFGCIIKVYFYNFLFNFVILFVAGEYVKHILSKTPEIW